MAIVVGTVIDHVRDLTPNAELISDQAIMRAIARAEKEIFEAAMLANEEAFADTVTVVVSDPVEGDAISLGGVQFYLIIDCIATYDNDDRQVVMVLPRRMRMETPGHSLAIYHIGQSLFYRSLEEGGEWDEVASLEITYVPVPTAPDSLADTLTAPDICERFIVARTACYVARAVTGKKDPDIEAEAAEAKAQLLTVISNQDSTTTWSTRVLD